MKLLNIGCGSQCHPAWTNIDIVSTSPNVITFDIRKGLPFDNNIFDAVYHSHLLEHLPQDNALALLTEALRVLKPDGIMRVVIPDLETIARLYLNKLDLALKNTPGAEDDYDWIILELLDQAVRNESGGDMGRYLMQPRLRNREFVFSRIGSEATNFLNTIKRRRSFLKVITEMKLSAAITLMRRLTAQVMAGLAAGARGRRAFQTGAFRESGEVHLWMYDRYSLRRLMIRAGFANVILRSADESAIPNFNSYELDIVNGHIRKPDSLFMEGSKR